MPIGEQLISFTISIVSGCLAGLLYDFYRAFVSFARLRKLTRGIGNILFWIILAGIIFTLFFISNGGEIRTVMFMGAGLGALMYFKIFENKISLQIRRFYELIKTVFLFLLQVLKYTWLVLITPFKVICILLALPFKLVFFLCYKLYKCLFSILSNFAAWKIVSKIRSRIKKLLNCIIFWRKS
ncbi:MAG: spore cortex biosynthesis protein YabQ [Clostridiales bacterium]|nr:spore cortex biosynthesis protein YabQ [Clostridiales bacterium]MCF8021580.1 spore cortex biosynthesis protein YabQ [Clostridiales bacterium]